jgi:hypothetical protein
MTEPLRIFSGWDARQAEAADVFAFSVREHASAPFEIRFVSADPAVPGGPVCKRQAVTSFTYARFMVPSLCGYEGVAVYADGCDQLCLGDVDELRAFADYDMNGCAVKVVKHAFRNQARPRSWTSLMLLDCARFKTWTPQFVETVPDDLLMRFGTLEDREIGELPWEWNSMIEPANPQPGLASLTTEPPADTKIAHWSYLADPNGDSWIDRSGSKVWAAARERRHMTGPIRKRRIPSPQS